MALVVHLPKAWHRAVIGNRGNNVNYVQKQFGVKISLPHAEKDSTEMTIEGDDAEGALGFIQEKLGFEISREPLSVASLSVGVDDAEKVFGDGKVGAMMKTFGVGIRVAGKPGETTLIQGPEKAIAEITTQLSASLGRDVTQEPQKEYNHRVNIHHQKIAESLFFAPDEADDSRDLNRFLEVLASGNHTLDICVFTLTSNRISKVIKSEHRSGVKVRIITDNETMHARGNDVQDLADYGIECKADVAEGHMHHKFAIIDNKLLINGSFNWTVGAGNMNYENITICNDADLIKDFNGEFERMWKDEERFTRV